MMFSIVSAKDVDELAAQDILKAVEADDVLLPTEVFQKIADGRAKLWVYRENEKHGVVITEEFYSTKGNTFWVSYVAGEGIAKRLRLLEKVLYKYARLNKFSTILMHANEDVAGLGEKLGYKKHAVVLRKEL